MTTDGSSTQRPARTQLVWLSCALAAAIAAAALWRPWERAPEAPRAAESGEPAAAAPAAAGALPRDAAPAGGAVEPGPELRTSALFVVRVVDGTGAPSRDCEVLVWREGTEEVLTRTTDAQGAASFAAHGGAGGVAALTDDGAWIVSRPIVLSGEHVLVFGGTSVVSGSVLVDGAPAPAGLQLELLAAAKPQPDGLPVDVLMRLGMRGQLRSTTTGAGGRFEFVGLREDWCGRLLPPLLHWFTPREGDAWEPRLLALAAPVTGLVVELTRLPLVSGRVVWDDDGAPIESVFVIAVADLDGTSAGGNARTAADGTFTLGLTPSFGSLQRQWADPGRRPPLNHLSLYCGQVSGSGGDARVDLDAPAVEQPVEIRVRRAVTTHFLVTDRHGEPIQGARVNVDQSSETDREGHGQSLGPAPTLVGARGYCVMPARAARGDGSADDPLCFVLPPVNRVHIAVSGIAAEAASSLEVAVESSVPITAGNPTWRSPFHDEFGGSKCGGGSSRFTLPNGESAERHSLDPDLDEAGRAEVHSLEPGIECVLVLRDKSGAALAQSAFRTPPFGEETSVELAFHRTPRRIRGKVARTDGTPFAGASVALRTGTGHAAAQTRDDGSYTFAPLYADAQIDLVVRAPGYVKSTRTGLLAADGDVHHFRLEPGRQITVRVLDESGEPVDVFAQPSGFEEQEAQRMGEGLWLWSDVTPGVEFWAEVPGRRFSVQHDGASAEVTLRVPELGRVTAPVSSLPAGLDRKKCYVELRCLSGGAHEPVYMRFTDDPQNAKWVLPGPHAAAIVQFRIYGDGRTEYVPLGFTKTIDVPAGKTTPITFE